MTFHIVTLFPGAFDSYLGESILKRALEDKKIRVKFYNPRDFADDKWQRVDQKPYGGGPGMVIQALPVAKALEKAVKAAGGKNGKAARDTKMIFFSPAGKSFDTAYAKATAKKYKNVIFVCGRYEGIDARVKKMFRMEDVSVGPFVLTGGELPAMIVMDSVSRQIEGVLGNYDSREEERISSSDVYTRPEVIEYRGKKYRVPKVLLSGNHKLIDEWKAGRKSA
ncbi:MAG TPA: tRNA (guanosine(37)-N1)-methyltransferase TrmD [Candidatus Paceibacterota bacterium]|nr:tRNA (guanosine(37)-N1)-methyltransferase TrmD [Candidatus Paceibacterota bacterium]